MTETKPYERITQAARPIAQPLRQPKDLAPLIQRLAQARIVMLGEATHGTHEFYEWRRMITEWLIVKHGFTQIAVEGDWPPCRAIDRYIRSPRSSDRSPLHAFRRWPAWMWANQEMVRLVDWLKSHNQDSSFPNKVSFSGLDVYSLFESMHEATQTLDEIQPFLAKRVRMRYACFEPFHGDEKSYARSLVSVPDGCEREVVRNLEEILKARLNAEREGNTDAETLESFFDAEQNARIVLNAETYYRTLVHGNGDSWNVRDLHMMDTLDLLLKHGGPDSKIIVWAHNTHIGDYRATPMLAQGLLNLGGLARERYGEDQVALVGMSTARGSVLAAKRWEMTPEKFNLSLPPEGTYERVFRDLAQEMNVPAFSLVMDPSHREGPLGEVLGHRAIGVVHDPKTDWEGANYVPTSLARRYDAMVFIEETRALEPIEQEIDESEMPETYPVGF